MSLLNGINNQLIKNYGQKTAGVSEDLSGASARSTAGGAKDNAATIARTSADKAEIMGMARELLLSNEYTSGVYTRSSVQTSALRQSGLNSADSLFGLAQKLMGNQAQVGNSLRSVQESYYSFSLDMSFTKGNTEYNFSFSFESYSYSEEYYQDYGFINIDDATRAQAKSLISENGPLGVKAISENILGFAKAISGGDADSIEALKNAFTEAYTQIANVFGGVSSMPEVSSKTYDAIIKGFEEWLNSAQIVEAIEE